ncbi:MAG: HipA domain-containing protein [Eubacteriaceae bacterium]|nr:HipA domain-containing protein [Eubacteriaceae bacterium]
MAGGEKIIYVYMCENEKTNRLIGTMFSSSEKGREHYSFEYNEKWLQTSGTWLVLDPDLELYRGRQYVPVDKTMFGLFADSCPDRWGRLLMKRKEILEAKKEERKPKRMQETDYLLGVYDKSRMGALRFASEENGPFLSDDKGLATPPWTTLRKLESASLAFENDEGGIEEKWLDQLLQPGSSLGGARPKASVMAPDGSLWIAKFPSRHDEYDSGAWEMVVHDLALRCGLDVPEAKLETFSKTGSTFLVKRFDRDGEKRIHFASAMTLLGKTDGSSAEDGSSYLDIATFIRMNGSRPGDDLEQLWKRIVFSMAVSNTDDHLRNHGMILEANGWRMSPQYDVNPCIYGDSLSLNVSEDSNLMDFDLAVDTAEYYGIERNDAQKTAADISRTVSEKWRILAKKYGISRESSEYMAPAFCRKYKK